MFQRNLSAEMIQKLSESELFQLLRNDRSVFPALRNGYVDFYHCNGVLFRFDGKFMTHPKYASVLAYDNKSAVCEDSLKTAKPVLNFLTGYDRMRELCGKYSGEEACGVSAICCKYNYRNSNPGDIVVLDIEVAFRNVSKELADAPARNDPTIDKIDMLLFNTKIGALRFYEAKHFSNPELSAQKGDQPPVVSQVRRYEAQIKNNRPEILKQYARYIGVINELLGRTFEVPRSIDDNVPLLVFGFDADQKAGRLKALTSILTGHEVKVYSKGDVKTLDINALWDAGK
jgi:hypothetical protein